MNLDFFENEMCSDVMIMMKIAQLLTDLLQVRSEVIATYALCGFDNFGSVGMQLGTLVSLVPERKRDFTSVAIRALGTAILACYVTACTAGRRR